jgi:NADH-ubiquinone oxidoreductase chain 1
LAEAESELVSGFMTEHAAVIFVFFFLAEYASIVLMCILTSILFLGGYLLDYTLPYFILQDTYLGYVLSDTISSLNTPVMEGLIYGLTIGIKTSIMIFVFI